MAKMGPILLGLGAAVLLLRKKGGSAPPTESYGFGGGDPGGSSDCHVLPGIWAPSQPAATSPLSEITSNQNLAILPLTPEGFLEIDATFQKFFEQNPGFDPVDGADAIVYWVASSVTEGRGLECPWGKPTQWTPRMKQMDGAVRLMLKEGTKPGGFLQPFIGG